MTALTVNGSTVVRSEAGRFHTHSLAGEPAADCAGSLKVHEATRPEFFAVVNARGIDAACCKRCAGVNYWSRAFRESL